MVGSISAAVALLSGSGSTLAPQRPTVRRAPLGPWPQPETYDQTLPVPWPAGRDLYWNRQQFCGIRIAGAPVVPGSSDTNPELVMACLLDNYPEWVQEAFFQQYTADGYTHLQRSLSHALGYGHSIQSYIALSNRARSVYGLFCDHWLIANEFPGWAPNQDASYWKPRLDPYIDQLVGAGVMDQCCPSWQMDQLQQGAPGNPTISIIAYVADKLPGSVPVYTHWVNDAMAWWKTGGEVWSDKYQTINVTDRFSWWQAMQPYLTGGHYQGDTTLARTQPTTYQGKIRDTLNNFVNGRMGQAQRRGFPENFRMTNYECTAQDQFNGTCTEQEGDTIGYILTCTKADGYDAGLSGYGNGARRPDGSAL